jgi:hypothetical protein
MIFMKRINIDTNKEYRMGDTPTKEDLPARKGKVFVRYGLSRTYKRTDLSKGFREGCNLERWVTPERLEKSRADGRSRSLQHQRNHKKEDGKLELNPATGKEWKKGEQNEQGWYFYNYKGYVKNDGYRAIHWQKTWQAYERKRIQAIQTNKPKYCRDRGLDIDITGVDGLDYLVSIFPKDYICPALGIKMKWNNSPHQGDSPSLDRLDPSKGYIRGNLEWISERANTMKHDATLEEVEALAKWLKKAYKKSGVQTL